MKPQDPCVICDKSIAASAKDKRWTKGNNAQPVREGQCCDYCNDHVVVPARLAMLQARNRP